MNTTDKTADAPVSALPQLIPIGQIMPDPKNRKEHDPQALAALAESIKVDGLLQPIVVRPIAGEKFMIVAGERRWRAHQLLKQEVIEARLIGNETDLQTTRKRIAENRHRENLTPVEEAQSFQDLIDTGMSQSEVAAFVGEAQSTVANQLRLLGLPPSVRKLIHEGKLSRAHGVALARFSKWPKAVAKMAQYSVEEETPAKELERDGVPFSYGLEREKLLFELPYGYTLTDAIKKDPDWIIRYNSGYCFDLAKGEAEKKRQDEARAKKTAAEAKGGKAPGGGMSTAEKAARARKIADNKTARALLAAGLAQASAKVKASQDDACKVLLLNCLEYRSRNRVVVAAETLGIKLPDSVKRNPSEKNLLQHLGLGTALKVAATAIMVGQTEEAARFAGALPEAVELVAGKVKPPKVSARNKKGENQS